jgi:Tfp pilus assembly protein PilO
MDKKKTILIILSLIIFVYFDFNFILKAQLKGINSLKPKVLNLKREIDSLNRDLAKMQELKLNQTKEKENLKFQSKKIITEEQLPSLLEEISLIANKNNVKIMQIVHAKEVKKEEKVPSGQNYLLLSVTLDLLCGYHNLGGFINELENAPQLLSIGDLKIANEANDYLNQKVNLVLKVYIRK